jgi:hypothetical protein
MSKWCVDAFALAGTPWQEKNVGNPCYGGVSWPEPNDIGSCKKAIDVSRTSPRSFSKQWLRVHPQQRGDESRMHTRKRDPKAVEKIEPQLQIRRKGETVV